MLVLSITLNVVDVVAVTVFVIIDDVNIATSVFVFLNVVGCIDAVQGMHLTF